VAFSVPIERETGILFQSCGNRTLGKLIAIIAKAARRMGLIASKNTLAGVIKRKRDIIQLPIEL